MEEVLMPKRIPHTNFEVITGENTTQDYLKMQKKLGGFYFKEFFGSFDKIVKGKRFLEVGPGLGYQTALVAQKYHPEEIVVLEYSEDMIVVAENYILQMGLQDAVQFVHGSVNDKQFVRQLSEFDVIYSTFSLHHWPAPKDCIANLYSSLNHEGILYIHDFYRGGLFYCLKIKKGIWESVRASYTTEEMKEMMDALQIKDYSLEKRGLYFSLVVHKSQ